MSKDKDDKARLERNDTGGHLGGTKFGQSPGTAGPNPARPDSDREGQRPAGAAVDDEDPDQSPMDDRHSGREKRNGQ